MRQVATPWFCLLSKGFDPQNFDYAQDDTMNFCCVVLFNQSCRGRLGRLRPYERSGFSDCPKNKIKRVILSEAVGEVELLRVERGMSEQAKARGTSGIY